jgi:hypothetical protein
VAVAKAKDECRIEATERLQKFVAPVRGCALSEFSDRILLHFGGMQTNI